MRKVHVEGCVLVKNVCSSRIEILEHVYFIYNVTRHEWNNSLLLAVPLSTIGGTQSLSCTLNGNGLPSTSQAIHGKYD